jgi:hypothetical protein
MCPVETERKVGSGVLGLISLWNEQKGAVEIAVSDSPRSAFAETY